MYKHQLTFDGEASVENAQAAWKVIQALLPDAEDTSELDPFGDPFILKFQTKEELSAEAKRQIKQHCKPDSWAYNTYEYRRGDPEPTKIEYGTGATVAYVSDCYPFTVIAVEADNAGNPKLVVIQRDQERIVGGKWPDHDYAYDRIPDNPDIRFVRKNRAGEWRTAGGQRVHIGSRRYYRDPHF